MRDYAVVCSYSWDENTAVYLFDTEDEAVAFLRQTFKDETDSDTDNGYHFDCEISQTGWYAKITNYRSTGDIDVTEYRVGHIYN